MATAPPNRRPASLLFWVVETPTGINHLVTEAAFVAGLADSGSYRAVCGVRFPAAPMVEAPRRTCARCRPVVAPARTSRRRRAGWWRRSRHVVSRSGGAPS
jgi:hypothetical protein